MNGSYLKTESGGILMGFARIFHIVIDINNAMAHMLEAICLNTKLLEQILNFIHLLFIIQLVWQHIPQ